jgi:hypothetical protein
MPVTYIDQGWITLKISKVLSEERLLLRIQKISCGRLMAVSEKSSVYPTNTLHNKLLALYSFTLAILS